MKRLIFIFLLFLAVSCGIIKPYQRTYLNEREMALEHKSVSFPETEAESYREGVSGANGGKSGGGCGCN